MKKRYLLIRQKGQRKKIIDSNDYAAGLENGAQLFNNKNDGYTYYVIDKLNPPIKKENIMEEKRWRITFDTQVEVEADNKEEAEEKARTLFYDGELECEISSTKRLWN